MFTEHFNKTITCIDDHITCEVGSITYQARIVADSCTRPDDFDEGYTWKDRERWEQDDWYYCGVVLSATTHDGWSKDYLQSRWGVEVNITDSNDYLREIANELLAEQLAEAV